MNDLISVLIPAYNHEKYIGECIQSIVNQTYDNLELIIIDDGSNDSTFKQILNEKEKNNSRFKRFHAETQTNQGTCNTLNKLLSLAQGKYIFMLASDDSIFPKTISELHSFLSKNEEYALAVGENVLMDKDSEECYWDVFRNIIYEKDKATFKTFSEFLMMCKRNVNFLSDDFGSYESLITGNYIPNGYLIRTNVFEKVGGFTPEAPLEDYYLMLQIAKYGKMKYLPIKTFRYRWHANNTASQQQKMVDMTEKTLMYEFKNIEKYEDPKIKLIILNRLNEILAK